MRNLYFENVPLEDEQKISCHNALVELAMNGLVEIFAFAVKEAHANSTPPIAPQTFWENLFIVNGTGNHPLMDEGSPNSSQHLPSDPYMEPDLQCWLKYLYFGRQRKDSQNNPIADTDAVLQFFQINYSHANYRSLTGTYGNHLRNMINIRNERIGHQSPARLQELDMEALRKHRDTMLELLEPLCKKNWSKKYESQALRRKILDVFYARLGKVRYKISSLLGYIDIPSRETERIKQILIAAGLQVDDDQVTLSMNPTDFADDLLKVMKRAGISDEARAAQLRSRLPGNEAEVTSLFIQKDSDNSMEKQSMKALEELIAAGNHDAEYEMAWRWHDKEDGSKTANRAEAVKWFQKAANAGHAKAQRVLGHWLRDGYNIQRDLDAAIFWLRAAAENQEGTAHYLLGECYEHGIGVEKNAEKAFSWYEKGAALQNAKCQFARAHCMLRGWGTTQDVDTAVFEFQKLDLQQMAKATWALGTYYKQSDPKKALSYFQKAADLNFPQAQYDLALYYEKGEYLAQDPQLAEKLIKKAAAGRDSRALYRLGCYFKDGTHGEDRNEKQAFQFFLMAAQKQHADSSYEVACCYKDGKGVEKDLQKAKDYLRLPAERGNVKAQYLLGNLYLQSQDRLSNLYLQSQDPHLEKAGIAYLEKAVEQDYAPAALALGNHFNKNLLTRRVAPLYYEKAGKLGDPEGYYRLANHYIYSSYPFDSAEMRSKNLQKGLTWLRKAAENEHMHAMRKLAEYILSGEYTTPIPPYPTMQAAAQALLEKALKKGAIGAAYPLAKLLEAGKDYQGALANYRFAAEKGVPDAQFVLFKIYAQGLWGVSKNPAEAMKWLEKSADRYLPKALHQMGLCYEKGMGVPKDIPKAIEWYEKLLVSSRGAKYAHRDAVQEKVNTLKNK